MVLAGPYTAVGIQVGSKKPAAGECGRFHMEMGKDTDLEQTFASECIPVSEVLVLPVTCNLMPSFPPAHK